LRLRARIRRNRSRFRTHLGSLATGKNVNVFKWADDGESAPLQLFEETWHGTGAMANSELHSVVLSQSREGVDIFFSPIEDKIIVGVDVEAWLSTTAFKNGDHCEEMVSVKESVCPVCLEKVACGQLTSMFKCGHALHFECASSWISTCIQKSRPAPCPLCNYVVISPVFQSLAPREAHDQVAAVGQEGLDAVEEDLQVRAPARAGFFQRRMRYLCRKWSWLWTT